MSQQRTAHSLAGYRERIQLWLLREEYLGSKLFPPWHQAFSSFFWVPGSTDSQLENAVQKSHELQEFVVEQNNFLLLCFIGQWNLCPLLYTTGIKGLFISYLQLEHRRVYLFKPESNLNKNGFKLLLFLKTLVLCLMEFWDILLLTCPIKWKSDVQHCL